MTDELYELQLDPSRARGLVARLGVWLGLAVMIGVAGLAVWAMSDNETAPSENADDGEAIAVDVAGPYNGLESLGLPIVVDPSVGLVDEQSVHVTAQGFSANSELAVVQCWGVGNGAGSVENCDAGNYALTTSNEQGGVDATYTVHRFISTGFGERDCAVPGEGFSCGIAIASTSDYDESGIATTWFDPAAAGEQAPVIVARPSGGLNDGDEITITGSNMVPGEVARITQCVLNSTGIPGCFSNNPTGEIVVDADGAFAVTLEAQRIVTGFSGPIDCVTDPYGCSVVVAGEKIPNPARLLYDGSTRPPSEPSATVSPSSGLVDGDLVSVELTDLAVGGDSYLLQQCVDIAGGAICVDVDFGVVVDDTISATGAVVRLIDVGDGTTRDCADPARRCYLRVETDVQVVERLPVAFQEVN